MLDTHKSTIGSPQRLQECEEEARKWSTFNSDMIRRMFDQPEYAETYDQVGVPLMWSIGSNFPADRDQHFYWLTQKLNNLDSLAERIDLFEVVPGIASSAPHAAISPRDPTSKKEVFIVHGRDNETKTVVARFIEHGGLTPIILHEQPDEGRTVIEKFEQTSNVSFAIVLLTPDDVGGLATGDGSPPPLQSRARQNVILELGYFLGRLGRKGVCALRKGDVEIPSDFNGVIYTTIDASEGWKITLARELKAAGLDFDAAKAMGIGN